MSSVIVLRNLTFWLKTTIHVPNTCTVVEHTEVDEHLEEIAKNLIAEHLFYRLLILLQQIIEHLRFLSTELIVKRVRLLRTPEYLFKI